MFILLTGCSKQCKECWDVELTFDFQYYFAWFEQIMELSETGRTIYSHESKQQLVLLWPYFHPFNFSYLVIQIFFIDFGQVRFFKKGLKWKKTCKTPKLLYHVKFTFLSWNFFPINEKRFDSSFLQTLHDGLACLLSTLWNEYNVHKKFETSS